MERMFSFLLAWVVYAVKRPDHLKCVPKYHTELSAPGRAESGAGVIILVNLCTSSKSPTVTSPTKTPEDLSMMSDNKKGEDTVLMKMWKRKRKRFRQKLRKE